MTQSPDARPSGNIARPQHACGLARGDSVTLSSALDFSTARQKSSIFLSADSNTPREAFEPPLKDETFEGDRSKRGSRIIPERRAQPGSAQSAFGMDTAASVLAAASWRS